MPKTMTIEERNAQLAAFTETAKLAATNGWQSYNTFNMALWFGEEGRKKLPKKYFEADGSFLRDDLEFAFNLGAQWHFAWVEIDKQVRPAMIQVLVQIILAALGVNIPVK